MMKNSSVELQKIATLLDSDNEENQLLGLTLCAAVSEIYVPEWQPVLEGIRYFYEKMTYQKTVVELMELETEIITLFYRLKKSFDIDNKAYWLAKFIGETFVFADTNSSVLIAFKKDLKEQLSLHDWIVFVLRTNAIWDMKEALEELHLLSMDSLDKNEYNVLNAWMDVYHYWKDDESAWGASFQSGWHEDLAIVSMQIMELIERYYYQKQTMKQLPAFIVNSLTLLWENASAQYYRKGIELGLQQKILNIITSPNFPKEECQGILLRHNLFVFWKNHHKILDEAYKATIVNFYNKQELFVQNNIANFDLYHSVLDFSLLDDDSKELYKNTVHEIWSYYYLPELEPYLLKSLELYPKDTNTIFHLGQLYHSLKNSEKSMAYYQQFLELAPHKIPDNKFCISESTYETRCYEPSVLEVLTRVGELYEKNNKKEKAIDCYKKAIKLAPNHHQAPYLQLLQCSLKNKTNREEAYYLLEQLKRVCLELPNSSNYNKRLYKTSVQVVDCRQEWLQKYHYLVLNDFDVLSSVGFRDLGLSLASVYYDFAEWYYYNELNLEKSLEICLKLKTFFDAEHLKIDKPYNKNLSYPLPTKDIKLEDVLYLQAQLVTDLYSDYWQAESLYKKALKLNPKHHLAKKAIQNIKEKRGW